MSRILLTSGPTRQYLDPVRYLSNASSGRMGKALAEALLAAGHEVVIVSGPVDLKYPAAAEVVPVVSTEEMLAACLRLFPACDGLIAVAAPCDYRPKAVASQKIRKTGRPLEIALVETPDIVARLGKIKQARWMVAFALETEDIHLRRCENSKRRTAILSSSTARRRSAWPRRKYTCWIAPGRCWPLCKGSKRRVARGSCGSLERIFCNRKGVGSL